MYLSEQEWSFVICYSYFQHARLYGRAYQDNSLLTNILGELAPTTHSAK